ncbi:hypothetical protein D9756_011351 [Leucocoprinus leucothites]|uniref:Major facilitator superfamily (MFS) profile domain-containing protein n=1 Tax=Leucocoprinus leucothites TaxID=201217 RepID=A0A8H5FPI9_9AGAR|nr:hypothetical protein D9756_011351 [Leucoagaricus leucothites]
MGISSLEHVTSCGPEDPEKGLDNSVADEGENSIIKPSIDRTAHPDGGLRAWGVVLGAFFIQFCSYGYIFFSYCLMTDYYTRIYMTAYSASSIAWIGSVSPFLLFAIGLFVGRLYDRGYCMHLVYGGALLISLSLFMLSLIKHNQYYGAFLCQGVGVGLGGGMIYLPSLVIVSQYFDKKRAVAMPIVTAGASLGAVVSPIMLNSLLQRPNMTFAIVSSIYASLITAILILACYLMKPRFAPPKSYANYSESLRRFSRDTAFVTVTIGLALFGLGVLFPLFFLQLAAIENGLSKEFAFYSLVILNGCGFFGRIACAFLTRRIGVDTLAMVSIVVCGGVVFAFMAIRSVLSVVFVGVVFGFFWGIFVATCSPLVAMLTDNMEEIGLRLGTAFAFAGLAELIGPPIMGALRSGNHWWRPAVFSGTLLIATGACILAVRIISRRRKVSSTA